jgi:NitT/TauT family transport system substrate-binding protein
MKNKFVWGLIIVVLSVVGFMVFGKKPTPPTSEPLRVSFHSWIGNGIYLIAKEKGFWEKEGLKVELQQVDDNAVSKQLLSSNKVDGIMGWTPETIQVLADSGVPMKVVFATDVSDGADGIIAKEGINTLEDLKGKTLSFESGSPSHLFLSYLLDQAGISISEIKTVNQTASDAGAAFVAGKVDSAVTWEPWLTKASERKGGHILVSTKDLPILPALPAFRTAVVTNRPQDVKAFMRGVFAAMDYVKSNPDESYEIIAKGYNLSKQEVVDQIPTFHWMNYQDNLKYFSQSTDPSVYSLINKTGDLWLKLGLIKKSTPANSIVDDSLLKSLNK